MYKAVLIYFAAVNLIGCIINLLDKSFAKSGARRIPERTLWLFGILGGAPAEYLTMKLIRHKTKHKSFMIGMPLLAILTVAVLALLLWYTLPFMQTLPK